MTLSPLIITVVSSILFGVSTFLLRRKGLLKGFVVTSIFVLNMLTCLLSWVGVYAYFLTQADTREVTYVFYAIIFASVSLVLLAIALSKSFAQPETIASVLWLAVKGFLIVIVLFSVVIQAGLISLLIEHHNMPHGESRGFAGMGILAVLVASLYVVVPGTIISLVGMIVAFGRQTKGENAVLPLGFYSFSTALPLFVYWVVQWSDKG